MILVADILLVQKKSCEYRKCKLTNVNLSMTIITCSKSAPQWQELTMKFDNLIMVMDFILYETLLLRNEILHKLKAQLTVPSFQILGLMLMILPQARLPF